LGVPAIVFLVSARKQRSKRSGAVRLGFVGMLGALLVCAVGCGGGSSGSSIGPGGNTIIGTPAGTYSLAVTSTSGTTQSVSIVKLVVQ
jgi:hypothetical protein